VVKSVSPSTRGLPGRQRSGRRMMRSAVKLLGSVGDKLLPRLPRILELVVLEAVIVHRSSRGNQAGGGV